MHLLPNCTPRFCKTFDAFMWYKLTKICIFSISLFCSYICVIYMYVSSLLLSSENMYIRVIYIYICMFPACCFRQRTCVVQSLFNGVLNETWSRQTGLYRDLCYSFLECVYFGLFYPSFYIYMQTDTLHKCMCVCVCVCVWLKERERERERESQMIKLF